MLTQPKGAKLLLGILAIALVSIGLTQLWDRAANPLHLVEQANRHSAARQRGLTTHSQTTDSTAHNSSILNKESVRPDSMTQARVVEMYGQLPMAFEANLGQIDPHVKFVSRGSGYNVFLTPNEAVLTLQRDQSNGGRHGAPRIPDTSTVLSAISDRSSATSNNVVRMKLMGANPTPHIEGMDELSGRSNYFMGNDPAKWRTGVARYARVQYKNVYPGVGLVYHGNQQQVEYDFVVAPRANPKSIRLAYKGATKIEIDSDGDLVLHTVGSEIKQKRPVVYQMSGQTREKIGGRYVLRGTHQVGFDIESYDTSKPLVIDPAFVYSTYLGGSAADIGYAITIDSAGNAYVTGRTYSTNFPTANPFRSTNSGLRDIIVTKLNSTGATILYSTYIGGAGDELAFAVATNSSGEAYVTGWTSSSNFPLVNALQPFYGGGTSDAFLVRLSASGNALISSTYAGGSGTDGGTGIALDSSRNIYGIGYTTSPNLQTINSIQPFNAGGYDAYLLELSPSADSIVFSTYAGGSGDDYGNAITVDSFGYIYAIGDTNSTNLTTMNALQPFKAGGFDAFLAKLTPSGTNVLFSTYAGGNGDDSGAGIAVDGFGNIYAVGYTNSTNLQLIVNAVQPNKGAGYDAFVAKLNPSGTTVLYSTFLGGNGDDFGLGIAVDTAGNAYLTGGTSSSNFPTMNPLQGISAGAEDVFVTKLSPTGSTILFSTYMGGAASDTGWGIAADQVGNAYVTGVTGSTNFSTANPVQPSTGGGSDAFLAKIATLATPTPTPTPLVSNVQFSATSYIVDEGAGSTTINVMRTGDTSGTVSVNFTTSDGSAQQRTDYATAAGTLGFAAGETSKTFTVLIVDDAYVEPAETINLTLSNPAGATFGSPSTATLTILDNDIEAPSTNPADNAQFFVRQHYYDFLSRSPDPSGLQYWTEQLTGNSGNNPPPCPIGDATCVRQRRINVSNAFFYELEFQQTGAYVYRLYRAAYGNSQPFPNTIPDPLHLGEENKLPSYAVFVSDRARVVGGANLAQAQLDLANAFVQRGEFLTKNPGGGTDFVDAVLATIKNDIGTDLTSQRGALLTLFNSGGRGAVMYRLADDNAQTNPINNRPFIDAEYNRAFVATQYFGYLRRNADIAGFLFWLGQVNSAALRDVAKQHAMVCSFITSVEYQQRFSPVVAHTNAECQ